MADHHRPWATFFDSLQAACRQMRQRTKIRSPLRSITLFLGSIRCPWLQCFWMGTIPENRTCCFIWAGLQHAGPMHFFGERGWSSLALVGNGPTNNSYAARCAFHSRPEIKSLPYPWESFGPVNSQHPVFGMIRIIEYSDSGVRFTHQSYHYVSSATK